MAIPDINAEFRKDNRMIITDNQLTQQLLSNK